MPQNSNKRYSELDKKYITENYKTMSVKDIATYLQRSTKSVRTQIERMNLSLNTLERNKGHIWNDYEIDFIKNNYENMSDKKISEIIGLSESIVCRKRLELGLRIQKREEFIIGGYYQKYINKKKVWVHRYNAEKKIGRKLLSTELVHHIDGNKLNNDYDNLYVCESKKKHGLVHATLEKVAFELYKNGYIKFDEDTGEYYISEQIRTEG